MGRRARSDGEPPRGKARRGHGRQIEILDGLQPGDRIAVAGASFLRDGMKVRDLGDALGGATMNLGELSVLQNRIVFVVMFLVLLGGVVAYQQLGRLEDPEFTIKEALIVTPYPGASAEEVAQEVTNPIESACQQLGQLKRVESESTRGRSVVTAIIKDRYQRGHDSPGLGRTSAQDQRRPIQAAAVGARQVDRDRRFRRRLRHLSGDHR